MKKSIISGILTFFMVFLTISGINAQKIGVYQCKWHAVISADDEEGLINQMQFNEKSQFLFFISNDEENLYVDIIQADKAAVQKIMRFGLTTWFNPEGKHKKGIGIQFPVAAEENSEPSFKREKGGDRKEMMLAMMARKNQEMVLIGFGGKGEQKVIDPRIDSSFHGQVKMMEGGRIHVSLVLPLEKLGRGNIETLNYPFSVGFETGYLDLNREGMTAGAGQGQGGGEMHGGGGMYGGGGPPPGGGTGTQVTGTNQQQQQQQPDISELASPSKLWISEVSLAGKP